MSRDLVAIEALDRNILNICTTINVATYELLVLVREFDGRAVLLESTCPDARRTQGQ